MDDGWRSSLGRSDSSDVLFFGTAGKAEAKLVLKLFSMVFSGSGVLLLTRRCWSR